MAAKSTMISVALWAVMTSSRVQCRRWDVARLVVSIVLVAKDAIIISHHYGKLVKWLPMSSAPSSSRRCCANTLPSQYVRHKINKRPLKVLAIRNRICLPGEVDHLITSAWLDESARHALAKETGTSGKTSSLGISLAVHSTVLYKVCRCCTDWAGVIS